MSGVHDLASVESVDLASTFIITISKKQQLQVLISNETQENPNLFKMTNAPAGEAILMLITSLVIGSIIWFKNSKQNEETPKQKEQAQTRMHAGTDLYLKFAERMRTRIRRPIRTSLSTSSNVETSTTSVSNILSSVNDTVQELSDAFLLTKIVRLHKEIKCCDKGDSGGGGGIWDDTELPFVKIKLDKMKVEYLQTRNEHVVSDITQLKTTIDDGEIWNDDELPIVQAKLKAMKALYLDGNNKKVD